MSSDSLEFLGFPCLIDWFLGLARERAQEGKRGCFFFARINEYDDNGGNDG